MKYYIGKNGKIYGEIDLKSAYYLAFGFDVDTIGEEELAKLLGIVGGHVPNLGDFITDGQTFNGTVFCYNDHNDNCDKRDRILMNDADRIVTALWQHFCSIKAHDPAVERMYVIDRDHIEEFMNSNPRARVSHWMFDDDEYIYVDEDTGWVRDERGYLFDDWISDGINRHDGLRMRCDCGWGMGWYVLYYKNGDLVTVPGKKED